MRAWLVPVAAAALGGCNLIGGNQQAAQPGEPAANQPAPGAPATATAMRPGLWRNTVEILEMNLPNVADGAPPPRIPRTTTNRCIGPAEAANPTFGMLAGNAQAGCRTERFSSTNGRIEGVAVCSARGGCRSGRQ